MKKYTLWSLLIIFIVICLSLVLLLREKWTDNKKPEEILNFSEDIQEVEISDGTSGNKVTITEAKDLDEIQSIIHASKFVVVSDAEDTTGYKWRAIIKINNETIDISGATNIVYDNQSIMFLENDDYARLEECISRIYYKHLLVLQCQ